ncbi:GntR family transcriptional regulator [Roseibium suaedae]|uniref:Transcriptional regulator, GntR family n=1 Tax=Roseibium suaedae TaxID=735517 RepID=A0A1M7P9T2_9HYPH|nr:GntR family transcriptional regulator [Roseibium suaedae]SHN13579.1 transcriptional regulator, GntR family [Roseibium suaedae]
MRLEKIKNTTTKTHAIRRRSLPEEIAEHLRTLIIEGTLKDGDRIVETELCEALSVSRTPMREAIKALTHEGLIEHLPNRGARVASVTPGEMHQLFQVISALEQLAVELAIAVSKPIDIKRLRALHDRMAGHHKAGERKEYFALNHQIHLKIVAMSGNPILIETHGNLMIRARHYRYWALADEDRWHEAMAEHDAIMEAMEAGDQARAGSLLKAHVRRTGEVAGSAVLGLATES